MITLYRAAYQDERRSSEFAGISTNPKPTDIENGAKFYEIDTAKTYRFDKENSAWIEQK